MVVDQVAIGTGCPFGKFNKVLASDGLHTPPGECDDVCVGGFCGPVQSAAVAEAADPEDFVEFIARLARYDGAPDLGPADSARGEGLVMGVAGGRSVTGAHLICAEGYLGVASPPDSRFGPVRWPVRARRLTS